MYMYVEQKFWNTESELYYHNISAEHNFSTRFPRTETVLIQNISISGSL